MRGIEKERGITLIALVVTLVILIILAAVSINMVLGIKEYLERHSKQQMLCMKQKQIHKQVLTV